MVAHNLYIVGKKLTFATTNLLPAITFILALICRYEKLAIHTLSSQAKVAGTLLGVGGAMLLTFYNIMPWHSRLKIKMYSLHSIGIIRILTLLKKHLKFD